MHKYERSEADSEPFNTEACGTGSKHCVLKAGTVSQLNTKADFFF
jgi:hypothetical protein